MLAHAAASGGGVKQCKWARDSALELVSLLPQPASHTARLFSSWGMGEEGGEGAGRVELQHQQRQQQLQLR